VNEIEKQALIDSIQADLDVVYVDDAIKSVCAPFSTLGADMVDRLPAYDGNVLVLSDLGLLVAVLRKFRPEQVTFVAHTDKQEAFAHRLTVKTWQVGYNDPIAQLEKHLMGLKFDIVVGNPPYQGDKSGGNKTHSLWKKFIRLAFVSITDGHIAMVTPSTWVVCPKTTALFASGSLSYAEFLDHSVFNVGVDISWWHWHAGPKIKTQLHVDGQTVMVDVSDVGSIPTKIVSEESLSIQQKTLLNGKPFTIVSSPIYYANKERTAKFVWPIYNTRAQPLSWGEKEPLDTKVLKVLFSNCGAFEPVLDKGTVGTCWHSHSIAVGSEDEAARLIKYLNSKLVKFLNQNNRLGGFAGTVFANNIPAVDISRTWSDSELYEQFCLTQSEIDLIERSVK
jgi:site-specific DNA-methyltransferase (adenine-specific)